MSVGAGGGDLVELLRALSGGAVLGYPLFDLLISCLTGGGLSGSILDFGELLAVAPEMALSGRPVAEYSGAATAKITVPAVTFTGVVEGRAAVDLSVRNGIAC